MDSNQVKEHSQVSEMGILNFFWIFSISHKCDGDGFAPINDEKFKTSVSNRWETTQSMMDYNLNIFIDFGIVLIESIQHI